MRELRPDELELRHLSLLEDMAGKMLGEWHAINLVQDMMRGAAKVLEVGDNGLLVVERLHTPAGANLHILGCEGTGMIRDRDAWWEEIEDLARKWNCQWIVWETADERATRFFEQIYNKRRRGAFFAEKVNGRRRNDGNEIHD